MPMSVIGSEKVFRASCLERPHQGLLEPVASGAENGLVNLPRTPAALDLSIGKNTALEQPQYCQQNCGIVFPMRGVAYSPSLWWKWLLATAQMPESSSSSMLDRLTTFSKAELLASEGCSAASLR